MSNLTTARDANMTVVNNVYDLLDRLTGRTISPSPGVSIGTLAETYKYDGLSHLIWAEDDDSKVVRTYDSLGDVLQETLTVEKGQAGAFSKNTTSTFDPAGNRASLTYPGGRALSYTSDALNRIKTITDGSLTGTLATYYYAGPFRTHQRWNTVNTTRSIVLHDAARRVSDTRHNQISSYALDSTSPLYDAPVNQYTTTPFDTRAYDNNGNLTALTQRLPHDLNGDGKVDNGDYEFWNDCKSAPHLMCDFQSL